MIKTEHKSEDVILRRRVLNYHLDNMIRFLYNDRRSVKFHCLSSTASNAYFNDYYQMLQINKKKEKDRLNNNEHSIRHG